MLFSRFRPLGSSCALLAAVALAPLALSCKDKPAETPTDTPVLAPPVASSVAPAASAPSPASSGSAGHAEGKRRGHGGPGAMLFRAARSLELSAEQKGKLDAAEKAAHEGATGASRDAMTKAAKELHAELVIGIKAGKLDAAKLEPRYAAIERLAAAAHDKEAEALNALHAALDGAQRKAVVADVRAKQAAREAKMGHHGDKADGGGHPRGDKADGGGHGHGDRDHGGKRALGHLTRGLDLDAEQQKKADALAARNDDKAGRPDPAEMKKHVEALLVAFEKDTFDAKKALAFDGKKARGPMAHETKLLTQLLPILKPEQREKLAAMMEKGPSPHGRRGGFGHHQEESNDED